MNTANSIFKFVSIRNATNEVKSDPILEIQPRTETVNSLVEILTSDKEQSEKLKLLNQSLNDFIKSNRFYKTKKELIESGAKILNLNHKKGDSDVMNHYYNLYDNIVIRTITKSNTNEVYNLLSERLKIVYQKLNPETVNTGNIQSLKIILPDGLNFPFSSATRENSSVSDSSEERNLILHQIDQLIKEKEQLLNSKNENVAKIRIEQEKIFRQQSEIAKTTILAVDPTEAL